MNNKDEDEHGMGMTVGEKLERTVQNPKRCLVSKSREKRDLGWNSVLECI